MIEMEKETLRIIKFRNFNTLEVMARIYANKGVKAGKKSSRRH